VTLVTKSRSYINWDVRNFDVGADAQLGIGGGRAAGGGRLRAAVRVDAAEVNGLAPKLQAFYSSSPAARRNKLERLSLTD